MICLKNNARFRLPQFTVREAVTEGTPGVLQLADLATKTLTKDRLWELLGLWGFIGGKLARLAGAIKMSAMVSLVQPADGETLAGKEAIQMSGTAELLVVSTLMCIAAIAFWEFLKFAAKWCMKQYKATKKARKLEVVLQTRGVAERGIRTWRH